MREKYGIESIRIYPIVKQFRFVKMNKHGLNYSSEYRSKNQNQ
jgi:hypothetical protein